MAPGIFVSRGSSYVPSTLSPPSISIVLVIGLILFFQRDFIFASICSLAISGTFWQERKWTDVKVHWKAQNDHDVNYFMIFEYTQYITITLWKKEGACYFLPFCREEKTGTESSNYWVNFSLRFVVQSGETHISWLSVQKSSHQIVFLKFYSKEHQGSKEVHGGQQVLSKQARPQDLQVSMRRAPGLLCL